MEARFDAELAEQKAEQSSLRRDLNATRDRVCKMRGKQSMADYKLSEHEVEIAVSQRLFEIFKDARQSEGEAARAVP